STGCLTVQWRHFLENKKEEEVRMCASSSFNIVISDISGKQCAGLPAFDDVIQGFRAFAVGDDGVDAVGGGKLCGLQLGAHAAGAAPGAGAARQRIDFL